MNNAIRIEITIEKQHSIGIRSEFVVHDMIFTEYERVLNADEIIANVRAALKINKGYEMMTIAAYAYDTNSYSFGKDYFSQSRFLYKYGITTVAHIHDAANCFQNWSECDGMKTICESIKYKVELGNRRFIELVKNTAQQTTTTNN